MALELKSLLPALADCVAVALQDGAFILCWPVDDTGPLPAPTVDTAVEIDLGAATLVVGLSLTAPLARQIAQDTLGEMDPRAVSDRDVQDAALELANVVAGRLAPRVAPQGAMVRLSAPRAQPRTPTTAACLTLQTDSGAHLRCWLAEGAR